MSGHNKWSKIKRKKGSEDAKKSKEFSRFAQLITVEVKKAGGDASSPGVRQVIDRAKAANMPNENIERAIARGTGDGDSVALQEFTYEAYGPGGTALLITGITDNNNRTSNEIKHLLSKSGAKWANPGSVLWAIEKKDGEWSPQEYSAIELSESDTEALYKLMDIIDDHDDVGDVYANNKESE